MTVRWDLRSCEISAWRKTSCLLRCFFLEQISNRRLFARNTVLEMCLFAFDTTRLGPFFLAYASCRCTVDCKRYRKLRDAVYLLLLLLLLLLFTAIEFSLGGSSPYNTSTDKTNKDKYT